MISKKEMKKDMLTSLKRLKWPSRMKKKEKQLTRVIIKQVKLIKACIL